jgi:hypothetical protein
MVGVVVDHEGAAALLADVEGLNPRERSRHLARAAVELTADRRVALLAALAAGDWYARRIGLLIAAVTGDTAYLGWAVTEPMLRGLALRSAAVPDSAVSWLAVDGPFAGRAAAVSWLRRHGRADLADRLLPEVRQRWGDGAAAPLLGACSGPVVAHWLPTLAYAVRGWTVLATRYPDEVAGYVEGVLTALDPSVRTAWLNERAALLRVLATVRPAVVLGWLERWHAGELPVPVTRLLAVDPRRVVRLVLADSLRVNQFRSTRLTRAQRDRLALVPDAMLSTLLAAADRLDALVVAVLRAIAPSRRDAVFDGAYAHRDTSGELLSVAVLERLPHARRHARARQMMAIPSMAGNPTSRWWVSSFLPYAEAVAELDEPLRSRSADERGQAYRCLVHAAARDPDPAAPRDMFGRLGRLRNEQDPVRYEALAALSEVPAARFGADLVPALTELVGDALDARDTSRSTRSAIEALALRLLIHTASAAPTGDALFDWAVDTVERMAAWRDAATGVRLDRMLRRGQEHVMFQRLRPILEARLERGAGRPVLNLVTALGRRAWAMPDLQALLPRVARLSSDVIEEEAITQWLMPPRGREAKLDTLIAFDESTICLPPVLAVAARRRVDLVDRLLLSNEEPPEGRFEPTADWVPAIPRRDLLTWTPGQVQRFAARVDAAIADTGLSRHDRADWADVRVAVPGTPLAGLTGLLDHPDVLIAERALAALADHDDPVAGLSELLARADDDRARVTLYAAGRCVREMWPADAGALLTGLLASAPKVGARKQAARLLTQLRLPVAVSALLVALDRTGEHRDVRAAVLGALRDWLDDERVWPALAASTTSDRHLAGALLGVNPAALAEVHRPRYAALVIGLARHPEPQVAVRALTELPDWARWPAGMAEALVAAAATGGPQAWAVAVDSAAEPLMHQAMPDLPAQLVAALIDGADLEPDATATADRPRRQRLDRFVNSLIGSAVRSRRNPTPVRRCADLLAAEPTLVPGAARLYGSLLTPDTLVTGLAALADLLAGYPMAANALRLWFPTWLKFDAEVLAAGAAALSGRADPAAGLLLLGVVQSGGQASGWVEPWRERLRALRRHPAVEVQVAALAAVTVTEPAHYQRQRRKRRR